MIKYLKDLRIHDTNAFVKIVSNLEKKDESGTKVWCINQKTKIVARVLLIFWKYKPKTESISIYKVIIRNTITIGNNLNGGMRALNKLSSTTVFVFFTIFLILEINIFAKIPLISRAKIIDKNIIPKSNKLIPNTPL